MSRDDVSDVPKVIEVTPDGEVMDAEREYATWGDLCEPPPVKHVQLRSGKWILYRPWLAADRLAEIQREASLDGRGRRSRQMDFVKYMTLVLREVMIRPKVDTAADARAAQKADGAVVMGVLSTVVDTDTFERMREALGED